MQRLPLSDWDQFTPISEDCHAHELVLQRCSPRPDQDPDALERLCLNLELPSPDRANHWLAHLRKQQLIWDPDPARVLLLRALGLPAWWLDQDNPLNDWLQQPMAYGVGRWGEQLGLPMPTPGALVVPRTSWSRFGIRPARKKRGKANRSIQIRSRLITCLAGPS